MKRILLIISLFFCNLSLITAQEWMTSLPIAKKLAFAQNKLIFMMWEESAQYQGPVVLVNAQGLNTIEDDFLNNQQINEAIWEYFVPVIVNESAYEELYKELKGKRKESYLTAFNDDSMKIMDPNGNIIGTSPEVSNFFNLSSFLNKYAYKTVFFKNELANYNSEKDFYSTLYLAIKYVDFAVYVNKAIRKEILDLSTIYFNEASTYISKEKKENQLRLQQSLELYTLTPYLVQKRPKKVLRALKKIDSKVLDNHEGLVAFLNYAAYLILDEEKKAEQWKSKVSLVNLRKAQLINNI